MFATRTLIQLSAICSLAVGSSCSPLQDPIVGRWQAVESDHELCQQNLSECTAEFLANGTVYCEYPRTRNGIGAICPEGDNDEWTAASGGRYLVMGFSSRDEVKIEGGRLVLENRWGRTVYRRD